MSKVNLTRDYYIAYSKAAQKRGKPQTEDISLPDQFTLYMKDDEYALMLRTGAMIYCSKDECDPEDMFPEMVHFTLVGMQEEELSGNGWEKIAVLRRRINGRWIILDNIPPIEEMRRINRIFPSV